MQTVRFLHESRYMYLLNSKHSYHDLTILFIISVPQQETVSAATWAFDYKDKYIVLTCRVCKRGISGRWVCEEMEQICGFHMSA